MNRFPHVLVVAVLAASVSGCGGGHRSSGGASGPPPSPDFAITIAPNSASMAPGGTLLAQVSVSAKNGFTGSVTVSLTGVPAGATVSPASTFTMNPGLQNIILKLPSNAATGNFTVTLQASSGSLQHSATVALQVQQQSFASFYVSLNNSQLSFSQGGSANTIVGIGLTSNGNANFEVQFSVAGLPSGVQASFGANPFIATQPATGLTFDASSTSGLANYTPVTITATRTADGVQASAQLLLNVTPPVGTLPAIRNDFVRTDGTPAAAVYDSLHNVVYASNPQWNRIDVISPSTHQVVNNISAPSPTGMDLSLDGKQLVVTSNVQQIVTIDTTSLQVVKRTSVSPIVQGGASYAIPGLITNTSNGTALVGMTLNSSPPAYYLEQWNPATDTFKARSAPGVSAWISQLVRTGDGAKALVVDYGTGVNMAVYDAATDSFSVSGQSPVGQVLGVAGSPTARQFAIVGTGGFAFVDSNLNVVANPPLGGTFWGIKYSADGTKLYVTMTLAFLLCGTNYPVVLTYDTSTFSLAGAGPAFQVQSGNFCWPYRQAFPLAADNAGTVYSAFSHGLVLEDGSNFQNLLNLPVGPPFPGVSWIDEARLNTPLVTGLGQIAFDTLPDVWFGNTRGTNVQFSGGLVSVTAPPSSTAGLVNVKAVLPDGWFSLAAQSFSYGTKILFLSGNAGAPQGGAALTLIGYGLIGNNGTAPTVSIGGQIAQVVTSGKFSSLTPSANYPFPAIDEVQVIVPPGAPGRADVTITSSVGTATLSKAFTYLPSIADYSSPDRFSFVLYDAQRRRVYLSAGDHIDVFAADTQQFLAPISPLALSGARQIRGLALTPDNSKLLAANFADMSVAIIDPDNPTSGTAIHIPVTVTNSPGVAAVVATSTGKVFVDGVSGTFAGCGGELWQLDLASHNVTLRTDLPFPALQVGGNNFSKSTMGSEVLLVGAGCGAYLWSAATDKFIQGGTANLSSSASGDGHWFAGDYTRFDPQMVLHMQAQMPEFFYTLPGISNSTFAGEKMNASGSLLYTPSSAGVDITDTNSGTWLGRVLLSEQVAPLTQGAMAFDETGNRLFLITDKGLTVVQLGAPPVSIGYLSPAMGSTSGSTSVTIRGSGFGSGAIVRFGGTTATTTFIDASTLQVVTPPGPPGGTRVSIQNTDGSSYSLDAGFTYQ